MMRGRKRAVLIRGVPESPWGNPVVSYILHRSAIGFTNPPYSHEISGTTNVAVNPTAAVCATTEVLYNRLVDHGHGIATTSYSNL